MSIIEQNLNKMIKAHRENYMFRDAEKIRKEMQQKELKEINEKAIIEFLEYEVSK